MLVLFSLVKPEHIYPITTPIAEFIIMSVILSCVGLLTAGLVTYLSFQTRDEVEALVTISFPHVKM